MQINSSCGCGAVQLPLDCGQVARRIIGLVKAGKLSAEMGAQLLDASAVAGSGASGSADEQEPKRKREEASPAEKETQEDPQHDSPPRKDPKVLETGLQGLCLMNASAFEH